MEFLQPFLPFVCLALLIGVGVLFVLMATLSRRFAAQTRMLRQFFTGPNGEDLEALLSRNLEESREAIANSQVALARSQECSLKQSAAVQHFALLRYDAFEDVMGQQSFSLALLDGRDNGAVITSLFGRTSSRCFGKMIVNGQPEQPLTEEERKVLLQALEQKVTISKSPRNQKNGASQNGQKSEEQVQNGQIELNGTAQN